MASTALFSHVDEIITLVPGNTKANPAVRQYNRLRRAYEKHLNEQECTQLWLDCWKKHGAAWLNPKGYQMEDMNVVVEYDREMRLCVSIFYRHALHIMENVQKEIAGLGDAASTGRSELICPDMLELLLFKCIYEAMGESHSDAKLLANLIAQIESDLGPVTGASMRPAQQPASSLASHPLVTQLMDVAKQLFNNNPGADGTAANPLAGFTDLLKDQSKMNKLQNAFSGLGQADGQQNLMERMKGLVQDDELRNMARAIMDPLLPPEVSSRIISEVNGIVGMGGSTTVSTIVDDIPVITDAVLAPDTGSIVMIRGSEEVDMKRAGGDVDLDAIMKECQ